MKNNILTFPDNEWSKKQKGGDNGQPVHEKPLNIRPLPPKTKDSCKHIYGWSRLYDREITKQEDIEKEIAEYDYAYPVEKFTYCPKCGERLIDE